MRIVPDTTLAINHRKNRAIWLTLPFDLALIEVAEAILYRYLLEFEDVQIINGAQNITKIIRGAYVQNLEVIKGNT